MALLNKKDLNSVFILLALVFLFDSVLSGFIIAGIIVFIVVVCLVLYSDKPESQKFLKPMSSKNKEMVLKAAIALVFVGVLLQSYLIIALGILVGPVILFASTDRLNIDLATFSVTDSVGPKPAMKPKPKKKQ